MKPDLTYEYRIVRRSLWYANQRGWFRHFHYQSELIIPLDGDFILSVNDVDYTIKKDECGIVFPYQIHEIKPINCESSIVILADPGWHPLFQKYFLEYLPVSNRVEKENFPSWIPELVRSYKETSYKGYRSEKESEMDNIESVSIDGMSKLIYSEILSRLPMAKVDEKRDSGTLNSVINWCNKHFTEPVTLDDAANDLFLSKSRISHLMSGTLKISFSRYISSLRVGRACDLLKNSNLPVSEIAFESGFGSLWSFNRNFRELVTMTPCEYRERQLECAGFAVNVRVDGKNK